MKLLSCVALGLLALSATACSERGQPDQSSGAPQPVVSTSQAVAAPAASSAEPAATKLAPMNVILLVVDAMRYDMPWEGYPRPIAPNLTALYERSVRWERGYSVSSFTSKSVAALLSGRYPSELARTTPFFTSYKDSNEMLAEHLQKAGVRTLSAHAHKYLDKASGLTQGFDVWRIVPGIQFDYNKDPYITSPKYTDLIVDILSQPENTSKPFFAYFHYMDPHHEYNSHAEAPQWGRNARAHYDQEIWFTDKYIRKMLDYVDSQPWGKNTAIIVTGDHGEAFGEHSMYRHAFELYEVLVRVPLFAVVPGVKPRAVKRWRGHVDLAPTICDLMGVPVPPELPGTSLVPEMLEGDQPPRPIIMDLPADSHNVRHRAVIEDGWKLIAFGKDRHFELYNVREDPDEKVNLIEKDKERAQAMIARYKELSATVKDVPAQGGKPVKDY